MAKQRVPGLPIDLMKTGKHVILTRNPLDILVRVYLHKQIEISFVVLVILPASGKYWHV